MMYPVTSHTSHVGQGSVFVACKSLSATSNVEQKQLRLEAFTSRIKEAIARGAKKIVLEKSWEGKIAEHGGVSFLFVDDCRKALAELSSAALGNPSHRLKIIGITGTKGKTSTAFLVEHILRTVGYKTGLLGSVKNKIIDGEVESRLTTPESDDLQMFFHQCVTKGVTHVVMEVSSHAIALSRVHGIPFFFLGFTNLAPEHMDFHPTMEEYFSTKMRLFSQLLPEGCVVVNGDDSWGRKAIELNRHRDVCSLEKDKTFAVEDGSGGALKLVIEEERLLVPTLFGNFNAYNVAMAYFLCRKVGCTKEAIASALATFPGVPGRLERHTLANGAQAFVDYAHNPSSFEAVLKELRSLTTHLIVLFGCGGDRDRTKRPVMARIAATYGDVIFITNDNPRNEDPHKIIEEVYAGIPEEKRGVTRCVVDRKEAIRQAVASLEENASGRPVIALLGKGHEKYYLCKGKKYFFSDGEEIKKYCGKELG